MYYSTIEYFFSDLHGLLSEAQNRGYLLIYRDLQGGELYLVGIPS